MSRVFGINLGLQARMTISIILLLITLMIVVTFMGIRRDTQGIFAQMQKDGVALAKSYALSAENAILLKAGLGRLTGEASRTRGIEYLEIVDGNRRIIGHTDVAQLGRIETDPLYLQALGTPITAVEKGKRPITRMDRKPNGGEVFRVLVPLVILDNVVGVLEIGLETSSIGEAVKRTNEQSLIIALGAIWVGSLCAWAFARTLTRPIQGLVRAAERIAAGDLDNEIAGPTGDEIGQLAQSFNYMIGRLREYMGSLVKANTQLEAHAATIEELRRYTENILASIRPGVLTLALDGRITTLNCAGAEILQVKEEDVLGKEFLCVFGQNDFTLLLHEALMHRSELRGREVAITARDGREALLLVNTSLLHESDGGLVGLAATFEDVTEFRQLQKRVSESEKLAAMGELVVGLAHEVRNPLGALKTCAQFLEDKFASDDVRYRFAQLIVRETERLDQLVERLLSFARPVEKNLQYEEINALLEEAATLAVLKAKERGISVVRDYCDRVPRVFVDAKRMIQCFLNVMLNAFDAMPGGGQLRLRTSCEKDMVVVEFADTGEGIPPERLEKIFSPFYTTRKSGTGLGLAVVQQIVLEHNGSIEVKSKVGEGTDFIIKLPAAEQAGFVVVQK